MFGFSIKDLLTKMVLLRCDSTGDLYPLCKNSHSTTGNNIFVVQLTGDLWHARLGHPGDSQLHQILCSFDFHCSKDTHTCDACRLGKNVRVHSNKVATFPFTLLHCDVWTSPVVNNSRFKYYLVILDDFTHFVWSFPLRHKSDVLATLISFHAFVQTQFNCPIACIQTNNGKEFDNSALRSFMAAHGMVLHLTYPYTSQQNGHAKRILRTLNDSMHTMLLHAGAPTSF
jgi:hypothetical protein